MKEWELPAIERESVGGVTQVSLHTAALTNRRILLFGEIDTQMLYSFTMQMMHLIEESLPISIYINSPGGEVNAGLAIYDLVCAYQSQIEITCVGMAASMGALIFSGGGRGHRYMLPHSKLMIHEPLISGGVGGSASSIKSTADSILETRALLNGILAKNTGRSLEEIDKATDHDNFMTAQEAIAFGLCDGVVEGIS